MDYTEDQTHADIRQAVRTLCKAFPDEYWMEHDDSHEFPWEFYNAVAEGGWLGLTIPEEYGGGGLGVTEAAIVEQEIAASGAGMGGCSAVHIGIFGFEPILKHGSEDLKRRFLPRVVTGDLHTSFARDRARRRHRHHQHLDLRHEGRRRLVGDRQEGLDHQGARGRADAAALPHQPPRARAPSRPTA